MDVNNALLGLKELHGVDIDTSLSRESFVGSLREKSRLELFKEAARLIKPISSEPAADLDALSRTLTCEGRAILETCLSYYTTNGWDKEMLISALSAFFKAERKEKDLLLLCEPLSQYVAKGWKVSSLLNAARCIFDSKENLEKLTSEHLFSFGISYAVLDLQRRNFSSEEKFAVAATVSKMIANGASPHLIELFCWVYNKALPHHQDEFRSHFINLSNIILRDPEVSLFSKIILPLGGDREALHLHVMGFKNALLVINSPRQEFKSNDIRSLFYEGVRSCLGAGSEVLVYIEFFSQLMRERDLPNNIFHLLNQTYHHHVGAELKELFRILTYIGSHSDSISTQMISNYIQADKKGLIKDTKDSLRMLGEIAAHSSVALGMVNSEDLSNEVDKLLIALHSEADEFETRMTEPLSSPIIYVKGLNLHPMLERVITIQSRMRDVYHGFGALAIEAAKPPGGDECLLARFASELGSVMRIYSKDGNEYPGMGYLISRLDLHKIFVATKGRGKNPFYDYQEAWPYYAKEFMDLGKAEFIFTRGFIAISVSESDKYKIKREKEKIPYSYLIFNDHFHNYDNHIAFLVPTKLLRDKLLPAIFECDPQLFDKESVRDVNEAGLSGRELLSDAQNMPPVLNIGSGANLLGGFGFSNPPGTALLFDWMKQQEGSDFGINAFGHPSYGWNSKQLLRIGREDQRIFELINRYQNVFDLFRIAQALWHKGFTSGKGEFKDSGDLSTYESDSLEEKPQFIEDERKVQKVRNERSLLMLKEAFKWHQGVRLGYIKKQMAPVLVSCDTRGYSRIPDGDILLDTADLSLKIGEKRVKISGELSGPTSNDEKIWLFEVMPRLKDTFVDIKFYKREVLKI